MTVDEQLWDPDEELALERLYGPWRSLSPAEVAALMEGVQAPWWLAGGHAIEAFTGVPRPHEDADMCFFGRDVPELRRHFEGRYHLWSVHAATFRPLTDDHPEPLDLRSQIWIREHSQAPWLVDGLITPDVDGRWLSKRDPTHVADLDEVTWVAGDGVRYLDPEIVLLFKASLDRRKDRRDLEVAWPLLGEKRQTWLMDSLARLYPDHRWREVLLVGEPVRWPGQGVAPGPVRTRPSGSEDEDGRQDI